MTNIKKAFSNIILSYMIFPIFGIVGAIPLLFTDTILPFVMAICVAILLHVAFLIKTYKGITL